MATYATLTVKADDIIGADYDPSRASVYIETNTDHSAIVVDGQQIQVGGRSEKFVNGVATFRLVTTNSADNPTVFAYRGTITYIEKGSRSQGRQYLPISDFPLTADANLAAIPEAWDGLAIAPTWQSDFRDEMAALLADVVDISGIGTPDAVVAALVTGTAGAGPLTRAALGTQTVNLAAGNVTLTAIAARAYEMTGATTSRTVTVPNADWAATFTNSTDYDQTVLRSGATVGALIPAGATAELRG